jgi:DNA-binding Lrp family transcriptional regulator
MTQEMRETRMLDDADRRLLNLLQRRAEMTAEELGQALTLSASQAARRRRRLETAGFVTGYGARLDPARLGLTVQAFVQVEMAAHSADRAKSFLSLVSTLPEVTGCWTMTGQADYLLRVWCADLADLNRLIQERLLPHPTVARVNSQIVLDQPKRDTELPVG